MRSSHTHTDTQSYTHTRVHRCQTECSSRRKVVASDKSKCTMQLISTTLSRQLKQSVVMVLLKLLMNLLVQCGVSLTLTQWIAGALLERTVVMQLGNWSCATHQLTMGLPQGSPLSLSLYSVYTKGLADLNQKWAPPGTHTGTETTGSYTKQQGTPRRQLKLCNKKWKMYTNGAKTLAL